jgi:hypothetical protein
MNKRIIFVQSSLISVFLIAASSCETKTTTPYATRVDGSSNTNIPAESIKATSESGAPEHVASESNNSGSTKSAANTLEVPFDQIWGFNLSPGMHEMSASKKNDNPRSDPSVPPTPESVQRAWELSSWVAPEGPLLEPIIRSLKWVPVDRKTDSGFAVSGRDMGALQAAYDVLISHKSIQNTFAQDSEISLIFFASPVGEPLVFDSVTRDGSIIELKYHLVYSQVHDSWPSFAIIPVGKLPSGNYEVRITRLRIEQKMNGAIMPPLGPEWEGRIACQPFSFTVKETGEQ